MSEAGNIADLFFATSRRFPDHPFLHAPSETAEIYALEQPNFTYAEARQAIDRLIVAYGRIGIGERMRVGLALENRPEFFLNFIALNAVGASASPMNAATPTADLAFQIAHSECALIIAAPAHCARLAEASEGLTSGASPIIATPGALLQMRLQGASPPTNNIGARAKEAALLYTSGTTGAPKGCVLSNDYFLAIAELYVGLGGHVSFQEGRERIVTPLPTTHMNALACSFMAAISTGSCLIQVDRFHPKSWWATVRESRATIMHYLGVMPAMLLSAAPLQEDDFSGQIKFAFGAGCDPRHHAPFEERFGVKLIEAWAMTETGAGAWISAAFEPRNVGTRCFGRAPAGLEWKIVDEAGDDVERGNPGELLVRQKGPQPRLHFFSGYLKDEAATEDAWRGGWFHTGDAVRTDAEGNFYFVDRLKNVIRRSGENIAAMEVESVLMRHEAVSGCVVVPVPDDIRGDEVATLVITSDGKRDEAAARSIFDFSLENLAYFKAPGYVAFVDALPMTASEKIKRGEAKLIGRRLVESGACYNFTMFKKSRKD
jgi:acyl-coenzyme A synthetase/AMP-(fatty) acid ligase